jgi:hypothetical protein
MVKDVIFAQSIDVVLFFSHDITKDSDGILLDIFVIVIKTID